MKVQQETFMFYTSCCFPEWWQTTDGDMKCDSRSVGVRKIVTFAYVIRDFMDIGISKDETK